MPAVKSSQKSHELLCKIELCRACVDTYTSAPPELGPRHQNALVRAFDTRAQPRLACNINPSNQSIYQAILSLRLTAQHCDCRPAVSQLLIEGVTGCRQDRDQASYHLRPPRSFSFQSDHCSAVAVQVFERNYTEHCTPERSRVLD